MIAFVMAETIIDALETIQIQKEEGQPRFLPHAAFPLAHQLGLGVAKTVLQQTSIGQAGQVVVHGHVMDLLFNQLALTDIHHSANSPDNLAEAVPVYIRTDHHPQGLPLLAAHPKFLGIGCILLRLLDQGHATPLGPGSVEGVEQIDPILP